jgi:hypothetical protein
MNLLAVADWLGGLYLAAPLVAFFLGWTARALLLRHERNREVDACIRGLDQLTLNGVKLGEEQRRKLLEAVNHLLQRDGTSSAQGQEEFPAVGTPAWGKMNRRRAELIQKKNREPLSPDETAECERLQRLSREALERAYPRPSVDDEARLDRLEARLRGAEGKQE